jgi:hypothetical protein
MPLNAAIGPVFALYRPSGRHGHQFRRKKTSCGVVKSLFEASVKNARNGLYSAHRSDKLRRKLERHD